MRFPMKTRIGMNRTGIDRSIVKRADVARRRQFYPALFPTPFLAPRANKDYSQWSGPKPPLANHR
jgi:hypothetical protein